MKIIDSYKNSKNQILENYTDKEIIRADLGALLATLIIFIPVVFVIVELTTVFLMLPYLMVIFIVSGFLTASLLYNLFKIAIFNSYKRTNSINFKVIVAFNMIISIVFIAIVALIISLIIIPKFVL